MGHSPRQRHIIITDLNADWCERKVARETRNARTEVQGLVGTFDVLLEGEEKDAGLNTRGALMEQINPNNLLSTPPRSRQATQRSGSSSQLSPFEYQSRHGS